MKLEINNEELINHLNRQLTNILGGDDDIFPYLDECLVRLKKCFERTNNSYYQNGGQSYFSHYHSGQYSYITYLIQYIIEEIIII